MIDEVIYEAGHFTVCLRPKIQEEQAKAFADLREFLKRVESLPDSEVVVNNGFIEAFRFSKHDWANLIRQYKTAERAESLTQEFDRFFAYVEQRQSESN